MVQIAGCKHHRKALLSDADSGASPGVLPLRLLVAACRYAISAIRRAARLLPAWRGRAHHLPLAAHAPLRPESG